MAVLDGHIHIHQGPVEPEALLQRMAAAGVEGGVLISLPPESVWGTAVQPAQRLSNLLAWTTGFPTLFPFYWIDPLDKDAADQVEAAVEEGVAGFKVACNRFLPGDPRALELYRQIGFHGRPILFHSGVLNDGRASSQYNHPVHFEELLEVTSLRFSLAHAGWPWCEELIAVYGKFVQACGSQPFLAVEMYVDLAPSAPPGCRREILARLFGAGCRVERHAVFGSVGSSAGYDSARVSEAIAADRKQLDSFPLGPEASREIFGGNLRRFLGLAL